MSIKDVLLEFIDFLETIQNPVLVGHNIKTFDLSFLFNHLMKCEQWENFCEVVVGFVDTLPVFKKEFPNRSSYKQDILMKNLLHESYSAHNALDDVKALQKLCELVKILLSKHITSIYLNCNKQSCLEIAQRICMD